MASIKIDNLKVTGSELFTDGESFLSELSEEETLLQGGLYSISSVTILTTLRTGYWL